MFLKFSPDSLTYVLFLSVLFNPRVFGDFPAPFNSVVIIRGCPMSDFYLSRGCSWPRVWSVLMDVPWKLEKNAFLLLLDPAPRTVHHGRWYCWSQHCPSDFLSSGEALQSWLIVGVSAAPCGLSALPQDLTLLGTCPSSHATDCCVFVELTSPWPFIIVEGHFIPDTSLLWCWLSLK